MHGCQTPSSAHEHGCCSNAIEQDDVRENNDQCAARCGRPITPRPAAGVVCAKPVPTTWVWGMTLSVAVFLAVALAAGERTPETISTETRLRAETKTETKNKKKYEKQQVAAPRPEGRTAPDGTSGPGQRLREGSEIADQLGQFRDTGGRIVFQARDSELSLQVLENLALERISRVLEEARPVRMWSVSGVVTEYRGANYLLVTRAVLTAKGTAEPASQTTSKPPLAN